MPRALADASILGLTGVLESSLLVPHAMTHLHLDAARLQSPMLLKLPVAGHLTLYVARVHSRP